MGCGASRLDENGVVIPVKARPLLFLRLEEFKKRRHPQDCKESSSSKKELLSDKREADDVSSRMQSSAKKDGKESSLLTDDTGSCVTSEGSKGGSPERDGCNNDAKAKEEVKLIEKGKGEAHDEGRIIKSSAKDHHIHMHETKKVEHNMDGDVKIEDMDEDDGGEEGENNDDDDGRMLGHHDDDSAFPGSPSFRVYFTDNKGGNKNEDADDDLTEKAPIEKDHPKPLQQPPVPVNKEVRKEKKRRSFKKVLPTGRHAKNLFNVRACMSSTHSNPDRTHLLTAKAHA